MSSPFIQAPTSLDHATALGFSQKAPLLLNRDSTLFSIPVVGAGETPEIWTLYEHLMLSCLQSGDDESAQQCLDKLTARFGAQNERVMGLHGLYKEAIAEDDAALGRVLKEYEAILREDPTNTPIAKRHIALLRSLSRHGDAVTALVRLLDASPTDIEAWAELSEVYLLQGQYAQAVYSLEEVLLTVPNAWNVHAAMAEALYQWAVARQAADEGDCERILVESMQRFCRSVELCDDYIRGYCGLLLTTIRLCSIKSPAPAKSEVHDPASPPLEILENLKQKATKKLAEIVRRSTAREEGWDGYDPVELHAAQRLLEDGTQTAQKQ